MWSGSVNSGTYTISTGLWSDYKAIILTGMKQNYYQSITITIGEWNLVHYECPIYFIYVGSYGVYAYKVGTNQFTVVDIASAGYYLTRVEGIL